MMLLSYGVRAVTLCRIRAQGSAAINMCTVASGRADAYWEFGIHAWDMAAGDLIVREAGGVVISTDCMMIVCLISLYLIGQICISFQ